MVGLVQQVNKYVDGDSNLYVYLGLTSTVMSKKLPRMQCMYTLLSEQ